LNKNLSLKLNSHNVCQKNLLFTISLLCVLLFISLFVANVEGQNTAQVDAEQKIKDIFNNALNDPITFLKEALTYLSIVITAWCTIILYIWYLLLGWIGI
jgi:hypothetical protein